MEEIYYLLCLKINAGECRLYDKRERELYSKICTMAEAKQIKDYCGLNYTRFCMLLITTDTILISVYINKWETFPQ